VSRPNCELDGASIVLLGAFNPRIFQPSWLGTNQLLRPEEVEVATKDPNCVITRELTSYKADWLELQVTEERFAAQAADPAKFAPLADLVMGAFRILEHSPVREMGLNRFMHYRMPSIEDFVGFGDFLAPKAPWKAVVANPGLLTMRIRDGNPASATVRRTVTIETSVRVNPGVYIEVNDHHRPSGDDLTKTVMETLKASWQSFQGDARQAGEHLFDHFYGANSNV